MKKAIVVGASSGIGKEIALILAKNGYRVGITGRRGPNLLEVKNTNPDKIIISSFDCTDENAEKKLSELAEALGGMNLLILSAGRGDLNENLEYIIERETNLLNVNAFTTIVTWAFKYFEIKKEGHVVAITSVAGIRGGRHSPAYNASKAYQINYLEGLRQKAERAQLPIFITDIRPGFVDTAMAKGGGQFWVAPPKKAAKQIFEAIKKKKSIAYVTRRWWLIGMLLKTIPSSLFKKL